MKGKANMAKSKKKSKAPWGYRLDGKPKRKPGRRKGQKNGTGKNAIAAKTAKRSKSKKKRR